MLSCVLAVCCENLIIDRNTNAASLINVMEQIQPERFPIVLGRMFCLFEFQRDPEDPAQSVGTIQVHLGETELMRGPYNVDFQGALKTRAIGNLQTLVIPAPGLLRTSLQIGGVTGYWDITCVVRPTQATLAFEQEPPAVPPLEPPRQVE